MDVETQPPHPSGEDATMGEGQGDGGQPESGRRFGSRTEKWAVTVQGRRHTKAHCKRCKLEFKEGEFRLCPTRAVDRASRFLHLDCIDATLPAADRIDGFGELGQQAQQDFREAMAPISDGISSQGTDLLEIRSTADTQVPSDAGMRRRGRLAGRNERTDERLDDVGADGNPTFVTFSRLEVAN